MINRFKDFLHEVKDWFVLLPVRMYIRKLVRSEPTLTDKEIFTKVCEHFNW